MIVALIAAKMNSCTTENALGTNRTKVKERDKTEREKEKKILFTGDETTEDQMINVCALQCCVRSSICFAIQ